MNIKEIDEFVNKLSEDQLIYTQKKIQKQLWYKHQSDNEFLKTKHRLRAKIIAISKVAGFEPCLTIESITDGVIIQGDIFMVNNIRFTIKNMETTGYASSSLSVYEHPCQLDIFINILDKYNLSDIKGGDIIEYVH